MRIIAGEYRGISLSAPRGSVARPTTDRVKESMFNLLGPEWSGGVAVDLFAGSGALGLEALSRGAQTAVFVDSSPKSIATVRENVERCRATARCVVWKHNWLCGWHQVASRWADVGWVFVDPPYAHNLWDSVLEVIGSGEVQVRFGVVCEHPKHIRLRETSGVLTVSKTRSYGDIAVTIYRSQKEHNA